MNRKGIINLKIDFIPLLFFFLLPILFLYRGLFSSSEVIGASNADLRLIFFHTRFYGFNSLKQGCLPLWNPYLFAGTPFIATLHTAIFYPLNLIFLLFPTVYAINWSIATHLTLSAVFTYYLLRYFKVRRIGATISGIVYTFSAPQVMHIYAGHLNALSAMVWTPLMFLFLDRFLKEDGYKYGVFLSITIALQLLAGQPQYLFYSLIALLFYLLFSLPWLYGKGVSWDRVGLKLLSFAVFIILALFLSAVQILPTAEMVRYSARANLSYEWVSIFSFPPANLITFLIPDFFGDLINIPYWGKNYLWETTGYVGILPLLLTVIAILRVRRRTVWFFGSLAFLSLVLAMGKYTPLLKLSYTYVPGFNLFRGSSKWIFLNAFSIAVISGFGAEAVVNGIVGLKSRRFTISVIALALFVTTALALVLKLFDVNWFKTAIESSINSGDFYSNPQPYMQGGFENAATVIFRVSTLRTTGLLLLGAAVLLLYAYKKLGQRVFMVSFLTIIILDLFLFGMRYMVTFDQRQLYWDSEVVNFLKQDKEPFRVIAPAMEPNSGITSAVETPNGYDTIILKRYSEFINLSQGEPLDKQNLKINISKVNKLTDLLNIKYLLLFSSTKLDIPWFKMVFDNGQYSVYKNLNALPRAFVVHNAKVVQGRNTIFKFKEIISPEFNPNDYAIVEEEINNEYLPTSKSGQKSERIKFIHYSPNKVALETHLYQPGLLILGDVYYPGWKAYIDGRESKIYRTNYIMRGITLPKGRHLVEFRYQPFSFKMGAVVSLTALVFVAGFLVWDCRKKLRPE